MTPHNRERRSGVRGSARARRTVSAMEPTTTSPLVVTSATTDAPSSPSKRRPRTTTTTTSSTPPTPTNKPKKGPVKITTDEPTIQFVPHYSHYTIQEINSIWFTQTEIDRTISECRETLRCMQDGIPLAEDDDQGGFTTRGLEYMTTSGFDITTSSLDAVKLVLEEQARQKEEDYEEPNPEALAAAMEGISMHRLRIAHLAAMKDARGVYGDGKFKTTVRGGAPVRSRSLQRRQMAAAANGVRGGTMGPRSNSLGNLRERRSRRGSRGPMNRSTRRVMPNSTGNRANSDPSPVAARAVVDQVKLQADTTISTAAGSPATAARRKVAAAAVAAEFGL